MRHSKRCSNWKLTIRGATESRNSIAYQKTRMTESWLCRWAFLSRQGRNFFFLPWRKAKGAVFLTRFLPPFQRKGFWTTSGFYGGPGMIREIFCWRDLARVICGYCNLGRPKIRNYRDFLRLNSFVVAMSK